MLPSFDAESTDDIASRDPKVTFGAANCVVRMSAVVVKSGFVRKFTVGRVEVPPCCFVMTVARV